MSKGSIKTILVAVNAQYIHTGLAVRSICAYVKKNTEYDISFVEYTINHQEAEILKGLYECQADVYLFSCYIWNIEMILRLTRDLRQLRPDVVIALGGPQVAYQEPAYLESLPEVDILLTGEGEQTVQALLDALSNGRPLAPLPGAISRQPDGRAAAGVVCRPMPLDELAFAYSDMDQLKGRIFYYESMRGCPFKCSYCTSSIERGVRIRSLPLVFQDLQVFLDHRVKQVKFVDRTFNCVPEHARGLWQWLVEHDNGITNFHFELSGELLDEDTLAFLSGVRPGLFQFEIGVQSTNEETLSEIERPAHVDLLFAKVRQLLKPGNVHVHLDLIAGLPYEDAKSFQRSFNQVYACQPHQLQLGFLKVLSGSQMEKKAGSYGLVYSRTAPYEILLSRWISYDTLTMLKAAAHMVDIYYNSGRFTHAIRWLAAHFPDAFAFYGLLGQHFDRVTMGHAVSEMGYYDILASFAEAQGIEITEQWQWLTKYDLLLQHKPRKKPDWVTVDMAPKYKEAIQGFLRDAANISTFLPEYAQEAVTHVERLAHLEVFPFDPDTATSGPVAVLFNYKRRDILGIAHTQKLSIQRMGDKG